MRLAALRPPMLRTEESEAQHRSATWLELFYDLVFVVAVAALGHRLLLDPSLAGVLEFVGLFVPLWWAWASFTFYSDRYDTDDLGQRLLAVAQIVAIALMAASISGDESDSTAAFAAAFVVARAVLLVMYARAHRAVPRTRELVAGYMRGFSTGGLLWLASIWVPAPWRYMLWVVGLVIDLVTPYRLRTVQARVPLDVSHLPERFGLFTILVLGESIAAVVSGISTHEWNAGTTTGGVLGVLVASGLWWLYFDNLEGSVVRRRPDQRTAWKPTAWIYSHLPLATSLTAVGIGLDFAVARHMNAGERWLLIGAVSVAFAAMAMIHLATERGDPRRDRRQAAVRMAAIPVLAVLGLLSGALDPNVLLALLAVVVGAQVVYDIQAYAPRN